MKQTRYFHHILFRAALCLGLLWPCLAAAQEIGSEEAPEKPVWSQNPNDSLKYGGRYRALENRRALVGPGSTVNKIVNVVGVGSWVQDLNNLTDEDLNNYVEFPKVVGAGVTVNPVTSVRDLNNHYAGGMKGGFCLVASSGTSVLSLDVIKAMSIQFYCDGAAVGDPVSVEEGQDASGVGLSLISIPGSEDACINLTATAPGEFDEVCLIDAGGVNLTVGSRIQVKYAFVGDAKEIKLTTNGVLEMNPDTVGVNEGYYLETAKGWNPVLLGIPFPLLDSNIAALIDDDYENYAPLTPIIAAGYQGGVKLCAAHHKSNEEVFKAGDEVGFQWINGAALDLDVGAWIRILLFDRNGNVVQEETVSGDVVGLGVASGGKGMSSVVAERDFSGAEIRFHTVLSVSVGAMGIYYGFVREQPEIPHHCDINPTVSTNVCGLQNSFQLEANPELSVTWSLVSAPADTSKVEVTPGGYVTNMDVDGFYVFKATAADGCTETVYLNKGDGLGIDGQVECGTPVVNMPLEGDEEEKYKLSDKIYDSSGSLLSISDLKNPQYILDTGLDSAATYTGGLGLANNLMMTGVKTTDGSLIFDGDGEDAVARRVGFVVEFETTGLSLSALQFFRIRCYNNGNEVYNNVVTETDVVSLGLAGSNKVQKLRFCIDVPTHDADGNAIRFDEFQLWKSGVLDLTISTLRIYYPFMEDATSDCGGVMSCVTETISVYDPNTGTGTSASINGNETQMAGAVAVAAVWDSLSCLIDNDLNSAFMMMNTVTVGGGNIIAVKTGRTLDFRHQLCLLVDEKTYAAGVEVGGWLTVRTYYRGVATGDEFTEWNVLGVNAIGYGDKSVMVMQPKQRYDEIRLEVAGIANVLEPQKFYGFFLRGDIDNDGIPDCQDPECCFANVDSLTIDPLCVGDSMYLSGKGMTESVYRLTMPEQKVDTTFTTDQKGYFRLGFRLDVAGRYQMQFYDGSGNLVTASPYSVHPLQTTWKKHPVNTDWNEWTNWTDGSPYCCTDVIIPTGADAYPLLADTVDRDNPDEYCCDDIHFEPGGAVDVTPRLNYMRAWTEMDLAPNRYYLLSAPLKHTYTGDVFIPAEPKELPYFTELVADSVPENRYDPRIYQRRWATTATGRLLNGTTVTIDTVAHVGIGVGTTSWSRNFNHLKHEYGEGEGFSVWVDNGTLPAGQTFRFRFPKKHTLYHYYDDFDHSQLAVTEEEYTRLGNERFIYEENDPMKMVSWDYVRRRAPETETATLEETTQHRTVYTVLPLTVRLESMEATTSFLTGNPFMSRIYLKGFFKDNPDVTAIQVYDGEKYVATTRDELSTAEEDEPYVGPMQSFFVTVPEEQKATGYNVIFDEWSLRPEVDEDHAEAGTTTQAALRVTADNGAVRAATLLVAGETTPAATLFDDEVPPVLAVFSLSEDEAFDIRSMAEDGCTPIGIYQSAGAADSLTLSFAAEGGISLADYRLLDRATGTLRALDAPVTLRGTGTTVNRYAVVPADYEPAPSAAAFAEVYVERQGHTVTAHSTGAGIAQLSAYATDGRRTAMAAGHGAQEASLSLSRGLHILQVRLEDGTVRSFKLLVRP